MEGRDIPEFKRGQATLDELQLALMRMRDPDEMIQHTLRVMARQIGVDHATFSDITAEGTAAAVLHEYLESRPSTMGVHRTGSYLNEKAIALLQAGENLVVDDVAANKHTSRHLANFRDVEVAAFVTAPLVSSEGLKAVIAVSSRTPRVWHPEEIDLLRDVAARLFPAVERARAEERLRASEELNRSTLQALTAQIAVIDRLGRIITVNHAWTENAAANGVGGQPRDAVGTNYLEVCLNGATVDADAARALAGITAVLAGRSQMFTMEYPCHTPQERRWFLMSVVPLSVGDRGGAVIAHSNITERKLAEEQLARTNLGLEALVADRARQLEAMLEAAASAILTIDTRGVIQSVNAATIKLFGYAKDQLIGHNVSILMPEPFSTEHDSYLKSYLATGKKKIIGIGRELDARRKDGSTFPVHLAVIEFDVDGRHYFTGILTDLTDRRAAEHSLREAERRLAQSEKMEAVGQLTGGLAHDINNMLTVVYGNLELAMPQVEDARVRAAIQRALDAVEMGAGLNRRLLTFARRSKLEPVLFDINTAVGEITKLLARTLGEHISLVPELGADLWQTRVDRSEVENALLNLAINSRDAMPGGGRLVIRTYNLKLDAEKAASEPDAQPGDYVCLAVTDTGVGMSPDVVRRAVEPFFTTKGPGKGTGLGLSSVYGFAHQSGGHLGIYSEVGKGTTITLYLPRAPAGGATGITSSSAKESIPSGNGELVLVVDDNEQVREVTLQRVEALGYAVLEAHDGPSGLRIIGSSEPIALVLTDVVMPSGMSGYDLARAAGKVKPGIKFVLASGFDAVEALYEVDDDKSFRLLRKPYTRAQLAHALCHALAG